MSAGRQIRQASKQTIKNEQCGSNLPKGVPQANSHNTWALARQGGYLWPIANWEQRYATYLQREIQTVPVRSEDGETRLGDRGLLRARAGYPPRPWEPWGGCAAQSRLGGGGGSPSPVATVRPRTRVRVWRAACAAGQIDAYAYARPRRRLGVVVWSRRPGAG